MNELRLLLIAAAMMTPMPVSAQAIDDSTTCATIRADLDADQPDRERVKAIFVYVANTLVTITSTPPKAARRSLVECPDRDAKTQSRW